MTKNNEAPEKHKTFSRLPTTVLPQHYDITLKPDFNKFTFDGVEQIKIVIKEPTKQIVLNALDVNIKSASFSVPSGTAIKADDIQLCPETEVAIIKFATSLAVGEGELVISYVGNLNDKLCGFYRSKHLTGDGKEKYAAVTHFEPTSARRAFPCWDEPAIKATFAMTLIVAKDKVALSNMSEKSVEAHEDPEYRVVKFETSPIMSTYLVGAIVGDFDYVEGKSADSVRVRVYTPVGKANLGQFSLDVAVKTLDFYNRYFNIPYGLPKMDLIAIPDFCIGAMENWALITFREQRLLVDPEHTSASIKQGTATVVAHELSHMWFGNLVTMEWWTDLWLKEGFATFMQFLSIDILYPQYDIWTLFVTGVYHSALELDGLHNSHPVEVPVENPSEIKEIFDEISYCKGASIIRMLHNSVGDEHFRQGLHNYLSKHAYKSTVTEDLWKALEEACKKPMGKMMNTWTKQKGYPVLSVSARQDGANLILAVEQQKFCTNGVLTDCDKSAMWVAPISVLVQGGRKVTTLMEGRSTEIVVKDLQPNQWVVLNPGAVDFYRVHYSPQLLSSIVAAIRNKALAPIDRRTVQADLFALVQAGKASTVELLKLLQAYVDEDKPIVWQSVNSCLETLSRLLANTEHGAAFQSFCRSLLSKIYAKVGWNKAANEEHADTLLRSLVLARLVASDDLEVIEQAKARFELHVTGQSVLPPDMRGVVYRAVARDCDEKTFDILRELHEKTDLNEEKNRILCSLASAKCPLRLQKVLEYCLSKEVRSQDSGYAIASVAVSSHGRDVAWKFLKDNNRILQDRLQSGGLLRHLVKDTAENFASEEKALEVEQFFAQHPHPGCERTVQQAIESIRLNAAWLTRDSAAIRDFFANQS